MKKNRLNITALCMLLVFLVGSVGVNVSRTYCSHCDLYRWQVFFVSFEENGADVQLCGWTDADLSASDERARIL